MKLCCKLYLAFLAMSACAAMGEARLFRIAASSGVQFTGISAEGEVTWTNHPPGELVEVEVLYGDVSSNEWVTYTQIQAGGATASTRVFSRATPRGFSLIPAGTFIMGSPTDEPYRADFEMQHQVTLTRSYYMQVTEVTTGQMVDVLNWAYGNEMVYATAEGVFNEEGVSKELLELDAAYNQISWDGSKLVASPGTEDYPCIEITWPGAQAYCNYLSDMEGLGRAIDFADWSWTLDADGYRLPTEAEWEYACRAGTTTAFYTGPIHEEGFSPPLDPNLDVAGWYRLNSTNPDVPLYQGRGPHPVGMKRPNPWGLYDMHGNLMEWCADWHEFFTLGSIDPTGPTEGWDRVMRGGHWDHKGDDCRSASRSYHGIEQNSIRHLGFRPVRRAAP